MKTVVLVGCGNEKAQGPSTAQNLYRSERFLLSRSLARDSGDKWFILSAEHGLVRPDALLEPYDKPISRLSKTEKKVWIANVLLKLKSHVSNDTRVILLGDPEYFDPFREYFAKAGQRVFAPFSHIAKINWLPWLRQTQSDSQRRKDIETFYSLMGHLEAGLGGPRQFERSSGSLPWPDRGLYLFLHPQESRLFAPQRDRIVRVGTHAVSKGSKSTIWQRLKTHRGNEDGSGNHRSSIFRSHVGDAIQHQNQKFIKTWNQEIADADVLLAEAPLELKVSAYLQRLNLLWLDISDAPSKFSDRAYLEQNIIALLSGPVGPIDVADESWLGYYCSNPSVCRSGLWNVNYTNFEYDPLFFSVLELYVDVTLGKRVPPAKSMAPATWHSAAQSGYRQGFLEIL